MYAQANEARVSHLRTRGGEHKIDLIVERGDGRVIDAQTVTLQQDGCARLRTQPGHSP